MRVKKVAGSERGSRHATPAGRSVFYDLFPPEKAAELEMRAQLLIGLEQWLEKSHMTQAEAAKVLGVTQARVSDLKKRQDRPIQYGLACAAGNARRTKAEAKTRSVADLRIIWQPNDALRRLSLGGMLPMI